MVWLCLLLCSLSVTSVFGTSVAAGSHLYNGHRHENHIVIEMKQTEAEIAWLAKPYHTPEEKQGTERRRERERGM